MKVLRIVVVIIALVVVVAAALSTPWLMVIESHTRTIEQPYATTQLHYYTLLETTELWKSTRSIVDQRELKIGWSYIKHQVLERDLKVFDRRQISLDVPRLSLSAENQSFVQLAFARSYYDAVLARDVYWVSRYLDDSNYAASMWISETFPLEKGADINIDFVDVEAPDESAVVLLWLWETEGRVRGDDKRWHWIDLKAGPDHLALATWFGGRSHMPYSEKLTVREPGEYIIVLINMEYHVVRVSFKLDSGQYIAEQLTKTSTELVTVTLTSTFTTTWNSTTYKRPLD